MRKPLLSVFLAMLMVSACGDPESVHDAPLQPDATPDLDAEVSIDAAVIDAEPPRPDARIFYDAPANEVSCSDGLDEDRDGEADCADLDCVGREGCEYAHELSCGDGIDNDSDGETDCADGECTDVPPCTIACPAGSTMTSLVDVAGQDLPELGTVTRTLTALSGTIITDVMVGVTILHPTDSQLELQLTAPSGTAVWLSRNRGGTGDGYHETLFTDSAATSITAGVAPFTGPHRPEQPLSALQGELVPGDWSFTVNDETSGTAGYLSSVSIYVCSCACEFGAACVDGEDNDADGATDCDDTECAADVRCIPEAECNDDLDNDLDLLVDCLDPDCAYGGPLCSAEADCADGTDEDADTLADCLDPGCAGVGICEFRREQTCDDGADNDGDGSVDCADADCDVTCLLGPCRGGLHHLDMTSTDVPVSIPDQGTAQSSIPITASRVVAGVLVGMSVNHTYNSEVDAYLVSAQGTRIELSTDNGSSYDNYVDTWFSDLAATPITAGATPFTGTFAPEAPLSGAIGELSVGTWSLEVSDDGTGDLGTIVDYKLRLCVCEGACEAPACDDGVDSDADGLVDCQDGDCAYAAACIHELDCADGIDNDSDGDVDCLDAECSLVAGCGVAACPAGYTTTDLLAAGLPLPIIDSGTMTATINSAVAGSVGYLTVGMSATHTYDSELDIFLVSPQGTRVELSTDNGSSYDDYTGTYFRDNAGLPITSGSAPFTGAYQPEQPLSTLLGESAAGAWVLEVTDDSSTDTGNLTAYSLRLCTCTSCELGAQCRDGADNDGDGATDCADTECATITLCAAESSCVDGVDNDGDGFEDCFDPGCGAELLCQPESSCTDGADDDGDGVADCADPGCHGISGCEFGMEHTCNDGIDNDGNGAVDCLEPACTLACSVLSCAGDELGYFATGLPQSVPDNNVAGLSVQIPVAAAGSITGVAIELSATHPNVADLDFRLTSPAGVSVALASDLGGSGDNYLNTILLDAAVAPILTATPPFSGQWSPEEPLAGMNGGTAAGNWTLSVVDDASGSTGSLEEFRLAICVGP